MTQLFQYFKKFNPLSKEAEKAIIEILTELKIKKNTIIQPIGHTCKTIYFIKTGVARIEQLEKGELNIEKDTIIVTACGKGGGRSEIASNYIRNN